ncbi:MAG: gliding motility-associated C-terminal domain-containing protein [Saprospiraceae bacterium]
MNYKGIYDLLLISLLIFPGIFFGQNLVPNPDFEIYTTCPNGFGILGPMVCPPWVNGNFTSADYFNVCSTAPQSGVPTNFQGFQVPHSADAYTGIWLKSGVPPDYWFEYIEAPLLTPLVAGHGYYVSFYVSLPEKFCALSHIGAYFSQNLVMHPSQGVIDVIPQVESNTGWLNDTINWMLIEGCFIAQGGEQYITIGNFRSYSNTPLEMCPSILMVTTYYFIDDVTVEEMPVNILDVDLGTNVNECYEYTIDPSVPSNVQYLWSDGSISPTLTVNQTGEYKLTITSGCDYGIDSIHVTITDKPPVEINPDQVTICQGDQYVINLDPSLGDYTWNDGSTDLNYFITSSGTYSVTLDDGCDLTSDEIEVEVVQPPPAISLGNDTVLCLGTVIGYFFNPSLGDFHWQDGSTDHVYSISEGGTYAVTISNMCGSTDAAIVIDEISETSVNLGPPVDVICDNEFIDINLDDDYASFVWQDGSTDPSYHITTPGLYSVTMSHVCGVSEDQILITHSLTPIVELGDTIHACPGDSIPLFVNDAMGNYIWQDGSNNDTLIISSAGDYALTVSNVCGEDSDAIHVQYSDILVSPALGSDASICPGEQIIFYAGLQNGHYLWQDGSTADSLVVNSTGVYSVTISNECFSFSDTVNVFVGNTAPFFTLPSQVVLCQGNTITLNPQITGVTYSWNNGSADTTLTVNNPGTYTLTVSNACGSFSDTTLVLDGGAVPFVNLGPDISLCPGQSMIIHPSLSNVDHLMWSDNSTMDSLMVSDSGFVEIAVFNGCGMSFDTLHVELLPGEPAFTLGSDVSLCKGESILLQIFSADVNIMWNDGSMGSSLLAQAPGQYFATISNTCGSSTDSLLVTMLPDIPVLDLGADQPLCPGEMIVISPGIPNVDYLWQDGSTDSVFVADHAQTISLSISNQCGSSSDAINIFSSNQGPDVDLGPDILACDGEMVTLQSNISGVDYLWQDGSIDPVFSTTISGMYYIQVSNSCGIDRDTVLVDIHGTSPVADLDQDTVLCEGNVLTLKSNADAETNVLWQDGTVLPDQVVSQAGLYSLNLSNRCGTSSDSIFVSYTLLPSQFDLGTDTVLCPGETLLLSAPGTSNALFWQDGSSGLTYLISNAGNYTLEVSNDCGSATDQIQIKYDDQVLVLPDFDTVQLCPGERTMFNAIQSINASYTWSNGSSLPILEASDPGNYSVTVTSACQQVSKSFTIILKPDCVRRHDIYIPNVFSPNGDGINDVFSMTISNGVEVLSNQGSIYDRWGNMVFQSGSIPFFWDGKFKTEHLSGGVYVYVLELSYLVNKEIIHEHFTGDVTLIK